MRGESQVRTSISGVSAGQRLRRFRAHNPKVAGSNPAPATKKTLGIPTCAEGFLASRVLDVALHRASIARDVRFDDDLMTAMRVEIHADRLDSVGCSAICTADEEECHYAQRASKDPWSQS
jgi:hypothetical protein